MPEAIQPDNPFALIPIEFWIWGAGTVLLSAGLGFIAGLWYARASVDWATRSAQKQVSTLYTLVLESLNKAHEACRVLESFPRLLLSTDQTEQLEGRRSGLVETIGRIVETQRDIVVKQKEKAAAAKLRLEEAKFTWVRTPDDITTSLPARAAFDANLDQLLQYSSAIEADSGLLLIKIDKADQLKARFGGGGIERFLKKMSMIIVRSIRDEDLVCRYSSDTFAVLFPSVDDETGRSLAHGIRIAIRNHHFQLEENGPEVLVTASFGYTRCPADDSPELAINRADDAVLKSVRMGRNHLHVNDGLSLHHCVGA
ncbi:MAG: GGDEF domain-containing protein [Planctomycetaceae bacterium]